MEVTFTGSVLFTSRVSMIVTVTAHIMNRPTVFFGTILTDAKAGYIRECGVVTRAMGYISL